MLWNTLYKNNGNLLCHLYKNTTGNKNSNVRRTKQNRIILLSNCGICGNKKLRLIKNQEASGLLSQLGTRPPLRNIPLFGDILF